MVADNLNKSLKKIAEDAVGKCNVSGPHDARFCSVHECYTRLDNICEGGSFMRQGYIQAMKDLMAKEKIEVPTEVEISKEKFNAK